MPQPFTISLERETVEDGSLGYFVRIDGAIQVPDEWSQHAIVTGLYAILRESTDDAVQIVEDIGARRVETVGG